MTPVNQIASCFLEEFKNVRVTVEERPFEGRVRSQTHSGLSPCDTPHGTLSAASSDRALSFPRTSTADTE